jgi:hypothetical protein
MRAGLLLVTAAVLSACGSHAAAVTVAPQPLPSPPAATAAPKPEAPPTPAERVQAILPHWLDLLARGDDARFLDEAVVPEELAKVVGSRSKDALVKSFKEDKHDDLVGILEKLRGAKPTRVVDEGRRTRVTYDVPGEPQITFQVIGDRVYVEN